LHGVALKPLSVPPFFTLQHPQNRFDEFLIPNLSVKFWEIPYRLTTLHHLSVRVAVGRRLARWHVTVLKRTFDCRRGAANILISGSLCSVEVEGKKTNYGNNTSGQKHAKTMKRRNNSSNSLCKS
jgi:hypothetical protein